MVFEDLRRDLRTHLTRMILAQGMGLVATGLVIGYLLVLALARLLSSQLYEVTPSDPWALGGAVLILTLVALFACYQPARRPARVDPIVTLRSEA